MTFPDSAVGRYISICDPDRTTVKSAFDAVMTLQQFGIATTQAAWPGSAQPRKTTQQENPHVLHRRFRDRGPDG